MNKIFFNFTKIAKKILAISCAILLFFIGYVVLAVHYWSVTDEGRLPPKTAVILYAVNENIITSKMKPPRFLTNTSPTTITKEELEISVGDNEVIAGRVYYPKSEGPHPIILYYHGGAFMEGYGSIETHDNIIRALAARTQSVVIAIGYRLAPTYVFPTAVDDSYAALLWTSENGGKYNGDVTKIAVAGDSAGGNIATAVALIARDKQGPTIRAQVLLYPLTTFLEMPLASRTIYDSGYYLLSRSVMFRARELYTPTEEMWESPYTSPLNAASLEGLPATLIITAEYDPLRDEGEAYAQKLSEDGVSVKHLHYKGVMHGFISFYEVMHLGDHGLSEIVSFIKEVYNSSSEHQYFERKVIQKPRGTDIIKEYVEAYAIAAYLIILETINEWPFS